MKAIILARVSTEDHKEASNEIRKAYFLANLSTF